MHNCQRLIKINESNMKEVLSWIKVFNESYHKQIIDPVGVVDGVNLSGRYIRQLLFSGQFDFYEIVEAESKIILGILVVANSQIVKLRASSLILFATNYEINLSNCFMNKGENLYVISIAMDAGNYLAVGFKNLAIIPGHNNSLNYLYLLVGAEDENKIN